MKYAAILKQDVDRFLCKENHYVSYYFNTQCIYDNEEDLKDDLKTYYRDYHTMKKGERVEICRLELTNCATLIKQDIDRLVKEE